jgi:NADH-quinone oxidoreductase subunit G
MPGRVTVTIDGREVQVEAGTLLIKVAQDHGVYIPRFCWHERMKPVGMCRMCLVEIEGQRGLPPACTATVTDGMVVRTQTEAVRKAQEGVLEFLLINHPLDCPVCDRGGECPLQDLTFGFGPGESRFVEEKRHFAKPIPVSDLVLLDRERCILCARCTRFADEVAGDPLISFVERGAEMQVLTFPDEPFASYFSGNTVQICPVGALLASPYRFRARPWDLSSVETTCQLCSVGCRQALQSSSNTLVRALGVDSEAVNQGWLCDKGRFGFDFVHGEGRWTEPLVRRDGELRPTTWPEALDAAAAGLRQAVERGGPSSVALLGGARGTNEDAYAWARLMKGALGSDNTDCQLGDGLPAELVCGVEQATLAEVDSARAVILLAPDLKEELPVAYLRLRRAALELGVPLVELAAADTGLSRVARARLRHLPGQAAALAERLVAAVEDPAAEVAAGDDRFAAAAALVRGDGEGTVVVVLGRPSPTATAEDTVAAAAVLARLPGVKFLSALRRGNVHGGLDMGLAPGMLPGRVALEAGGGWFKKAWGGVPETSGLDAAGILREAAEGYIFALVLVGADPLSDFPDRALARRALETVPVVVAVDAFPTGSSNMAQVVLPVALAGEKRGTTTNLEGRVQRVTRKISPPGSVMEDWRVAVELALRFGADFDLESVDEVTDEIARLAPSHRGVDIRLLRRALDGVAVPLGREEPILDGSGHTVYPAADADPGTTGGPVESLATVAGPPAGEARHSPPAGEARHSPPAEPARPAVPAPAGPSPPLHRWQPRAHSASPAVTGNGGGAFRLHSGRTLYDAGVSVTRSPTLAPLAAPPEVRIHPSEAQRLGLAAGARVRVVADEASVELPLRTDPGVPPGVAWIPFNPPGSGAADLAAGAAVTEVRVERITGPAAVEAAGPPAGEARPGPPAGEASHSG